MSNIDWQPRARELAQRMRDSGDITDASWAAAWASVPRHILVPYFYTQQGNTWHRVDSHTPEGLNATYSTTTLVTALSPPDSRGHREPVSSSTKPDLMARMLTTLDIHDAHRVLEIGTGTGLNAAVLSRRLGDACVYSVDVDPELVDLARWRLDSIDAHPALAAVDGITGWSQHGPYDRIIATCSVPCIPLAWAEQLTKDGTILVDVQLGTGAGNLVLLHRDRDSLTGRFLTRRGTFMPMRRPNTTTNTNPPPELDGPLRTSTTQTPPQIWVDAPLAWYLAQLGLPAGVGYGYLLDRERRTPRAVTVTAPDGSRAQVSLTADPHTGRHDLIEQGPTPLWPTISEAFTRWVELGEPSWERLGLTVTATEQTLWLDNATSSNTWRLANCA